MAYVYANPGPPFNFLGNFSETQRDALKNWISARQDNFEEIQEYHQMRAQTLRKTAGILETFYKQRSARDNSYATSADQETLAVRNNWKPAWQPGNDGHFHYSYRNDYLPMLAVSKIKTRFKEQLQRDDEGLFFMNHVRNLIENHEDLAQYSYDFVNSPAPAPSGLTGSGPVVTDTIEVDNLQQLLSLVDTYFAQPQYQAALVKDQSDQYKGEPRFRVHQFDEPTQWEKEQANHGSSNSPIKIKQIDPELDPIP